MRMWLAPRCMGGKQCWFAHLCRMARIEVVPVCRCATLCCSELVVDQESVTWLLDVLVEEDFPRLRELAEQARPQRLP